MDGPRESALLMGMVDGSTQHAQLAPHRSRRSTAPPIVGSCGFACYVRGCPALPELGKWHKRVGYAIDRDDGGGLRFGVVNQKVCNQDFIGSTWTSLSLPLVQELRERDFSLLAVCSARAALFASTALRPDDVVDASLLEEV